MLLELALRHEEEHDELDGLVVERVEVDARGAASESADDFWDEVGAGVRDADAKADPGAHGILALAHDGGDGLAILGLDLAAVDEEAEEFVNRGCSRGLWMPDGTKLGSVTYVEVTDRSVPEAQTTTSEESAT